MLSPSSSSLGEGDSAALLASPPVENQQTYVETLDIESKNSTSSSDIEIYDRFQWSVLFPCFSCFSKNERRYLDGYNDYVYNQERIHTLNILGFFLIGLVNNFGYVVMLSAAVDLLEDSLPAGVVLLADILPTFLVKLTAPFFMHRIYYSVRVYFVVIASILGMLITAFAPDVPLRLLGVILCSICAGTGEITFLAMTSFYPKSTVSGWSSGTGAAGIAGSMSYLALTAWVGLNMKQTLIFVAAVPLIMLFSYLAILTKPFKIKAADITSPTRSLSFNEKLHTIISLLPYMIPLFVVYYAEYLINQGISPTIDFRNDPFSQRDTYVYYAAIYQIGVFISRSSVSYFPITRIWIPALLQVLTALLLFFHSFFMEDFYIVPNVWISFAIILWEGLLGGSTYVNAFFLLSHRVESSKREFSLGVTSVADSFGISCAGLSSIFVEPFLKGRH
eukprot:GCRY01004273.1.p1 GENE.GCRY01004273.1~~GCRY01004273.1.p1  ORF type:complete len:448 (-),score=67.63 GCRY01004273.1:58-1401(-)